MNPLRKTDSRRGRGVRAQAGAAATRAQAGAAATRTQAGAAATRAQAGAAGVPQVPATHAQPVGGWWTTSSPNDGLYPPGGFTNYLQSNPFVNPIGNENFHYVGAPMSQSSMSPIDLGATRTPSPAHNDTVDDVDAQGTEMNSVNEDLRTDKRLNWSVDEDIRLASAWLRNSKDPVEGIGRKSDKYWDDVTEEYNKTTESSRKRNRNQLKIRWDRSKKPLSDFNGYWVNSQRVWQSGMSDDQLTQKALELYAGKNNGKAFGLLHMWKVVRGQQKWSSYLNRLNKENTKSVKANPAQVVNLEVGETEQTGEQRPMGHKKAKFERNGNGNGKKNPTIALSDFSGKFEKFIEASTKNREEREKMAEIQQSLADKKIEAAKLAHETAHEQTKCKMLETYSQLLLAPTDQLSADALEERKMALENMRLVLFPK